MMCIFKCCLQSQIIFSSKIWPVFSLCSSYSSVTMYYLKVEKKGLYPLQANTYTNEKNLSITSQALIFTVATALLEPPQWFTLLPPCKMRGMWAVCFVCLFLAQLFKKFWFTWKSHKIRGLAQVRSDFWSPSECRNPEAICCFSHHNFADKYI